jgi:bacillolysin
MANGFHYLAMRGADLTARLPEDLLFRSGAASGPSTNEAIARRYLDLALQTVSDEPVFRGVLAPQEPARVPSLELSDELRSPFGDNVLVRFHQRHRRVPVFGSRAVVDLDPSRSLNRVDLGVAYVGDLEEATARLPTVAPDRAGESLAGQTGIKDRLAGLIVPQLVLYPAAERFVLCWFFGDVEVPSEGDEEVIGEWGAPTGDRRLYDCFVDASSGELVARLPASHAFDIPVRCSGDDEFGVSRTFDGRRGASGVEMSDPVRAVRTYDHAYSAYDLNAPPPLVLPVHNASPTWGSVNPAAVTAHSNATIVYDFYEATCHRQSVDGKQTPLESVVNCADRYGKSAWPIAFFSRIDNRMVYGQDVDSAGRRISWARYLDIIAHELTHGVTKFTADLAYQGESGALNESISDIFAIAILNLSAGRSDPCGWTWELGPGMAAGGLPIRDMSDPARGAPSQPDHMTSYLVTSSDDGGVHTNSGIHNLAAHRIFIARLASGALALEPEDVIRVYYYVLSTLTSNATFLDARIRFIEVVRTEFEASSDLNEMILLYDAAYQSVGIQ